MNDGGALTPEGIRALTARDLDVVWHPCMQQRDLHEVAPLPVVSAQGSRITLADGRSLIDGISSWWCKSLGHGHPRLRTALIEQSERFEHVIAATTVQEGAVRLGERLVAIAGGGAPGRARHVFYAGDGSCGVEVALKMALQGQRQRGRPRATTIAALANGYHGETLGCLSVTDAGSYAEPFAAWLKPCPKLGPLPWRLGPEDPAWMDAGREWPALEAQLEALAPDLAAVIYEPVLQAAGGMRLCSPDLLPRLRRWADRHGVWLIADEIASGMGRCGAYLASQLASSDAQADLVVLSKGLTGGVLPLSAVLASAEVFAAFDGEWSSGRAFLHSHTFGGNALAVAVANAVLDVVAEERVLELVAGHGPLLREGLAEAAATRPQLRQVRGVGMVAAVDLCAADGGPLPRQARSGWRVAHAAAERGALLRPLGDTIYLLPPLNASRARCEQLVSILIAAIDAVL
jgi:adenosylmethionine-8-amino-7-oxononanoate aminotransferase